MPREVLAMRFTPEQERAVTLRGTNILLSAAAGSGKTTVLVERALRLIAEQGADIDRMLIVTFTNASAGDMRAKLRQALQDMAADADPARAAKGREQLIRLESASISTIHSFCSSFLRENFETAGVEPAFRVMDESEEARLREGALDEALREAYSSLARDADLRALDEGRGAEAVRSLADALMRASEDRSDPDAWLENAVSGEEGRFRDAMDAIKRSSLRDLDSAQVYWAMALEEEDCSFGQRAAIEKDMEKLKDVRAAADYEELREALEGFSFERIKGKKGEKAGDNADRLRKSGKDRVTNARIKEYPYAAAKADSERAQPSLRALARLVRSAREKERAAKEEKGLLTYADLEHRTLEVLRDESTGASAALRQKYDYVFVDEYQDTSSLQDDILRLAARDGGLFMVGDIKQSIYRFRSAEPELFMEKAERYRALDGGAYLPLTQNFRSTISVIDFVNAVFSRAMTGGDAEVLYTPDQYLRPADAAAQGPQCELHIVSGGDGEDGEDGGNFGAEARLIASAILEAKRETPGLAWRDIAVITRRGAKEVSRLRPALEQAGIPVYAEKEGGYYGAVEIRLALSILRLVMNSRSDIDLIGLLRSPLAGISADVLAAVRLSKPGAAFSEAAREYALTQGEGAHVIKEWFDRIDRWALASRSCALGETVRRAVEESGLVPFACSLPNGERRRANLNKLCEEADAYGRDVSPLLFRFLEDARRSEEKGEGENAPTIGEADDVVRMMTVHKSKGLEFRVVIAAGLGSKYAVRSVKGSLLAHKRLGVGIRVFDPGMRTLRRTIEMAAIEEESRKEGVAEEIRVLYVLLTRAKERLILTAEVKDGPEKAEREWRACAAKPGACERYLSLIMAAAYAGGGPENFPCSVAWHEAAPDMPEEERREGAYGGPLPDEELLRWRYPFANEGRRPVKLTATGLVREAEGPQEAVEVTPMPAFLGGTRELGGAGRGTAYHTVLRALDLDKIRGASGAALREEIVREMRAMREKNLITQEEKDSVDPGEVARFWESGEGRRALAAREIHREWPFNVYLDIRAETGRDEDGKVPVQGVIDLCYREGDGWVLLDYKTDRARDMEALRRHYEKQLETYAKALTVITGLPVKRRVLCLLGMGKALEL